MASDFNDRVIDETEISTVTPIINDFVQIDSTGQVFRYPEDIAGNAHLHKLGLINLGVLSECDGRTARGFGELALPYRGYSRISRRFLEVRFEPRHILTPNKHVTHSVSRKIFYILLSVC